MKRAYLFLLTLGLLFAALAAPARADAPIASGLDPLLLRLARHARGFETMKSKASFTLSGRMDELDGDGKAKSTKELVVDIHARDGQPPDTDVVRYSEDGKDKTAEAKADAQKRRAQNKKPKGKRMRDFHLPFLDTEQARYSFSLVERSASDPNHVRIAFVPKAIAEDAYKGSAWVDESAGEILSLGFSPTKNPSFVDHVDVTVEFNLPTTLGRAPSKLSFDARGGFLFIRKHYKGSATITNAHLAP
jgi:hypothetical protein